MRYNITIVKTYGGELKMQGLLSVVIPSYNEESMIEKAAFCIGKALFDGGVPHELIFVNDGSTDATWEKICAVCEAYPNARGVCFSRNFGKESAIAAGLAAAAGDCVAVIDCDLQHPPEKLVEMYVLWQQGYEVIEGQKSSRGKESGMHALAARSFYKLMSRAIGIDMANASDFKLLDRKAVDELNRMPERGAFFRALSSWVGFRTATVWFDVQERQAGESKWSTRALIRYALRDVSSFSNAPMQFVTVLGVLSLAAFAVWGIVSLILRIAGVYVSAATGLALLMLLIGGGVLLGLGVLGYYLGRIYDEIKARPKYIVSRTCGTPKEN